MTTAGARGRFITLEGPEGSGKTTAARHLVRWLEAHGVSAVLTREPGGTPLGDEIRTLVLHHRGLADDLDPRTDALLFAAQRAQHVARLIRPALERGSMGRLRAIRGFIARLPGSRVRQRPRRDADASRPSPPAGLSPDLTILIDVPVELGLARKRHGQWNRFEDTEGIAFFEKVRAAYLALAAAEPDRFRVIDGSGSVSAMDAAVTELVAPLLVADAGSLRGG